MNLIRNWRNKTSGTLIQKKAYEKEPPRKSEESHEKSAAGICRNKGSTKSKGGSDGTSGIKDGTKESETAK